MEVEKKRPYPQSSVTIRFNEGKKIPFLNRRCFYCGGQIYPLKKPILLPTRHLQKENFRLSVSFCSDSCIKSYHLGQRNANISGEIVTLQSYLRDVLEIKRISYPSPSLTLHEWYQWLPLEFAAKNSYRAQEFPLVGQKLVSFYQKEEEKKVLSEKEMWDHISKFRKEIEKLGPARKLESHSPVAPKLLPKLVKEPRWVATKPIAENVQALLERTQMRNSTILFTNISSELFLTSYYVCSQLPHWMKWRYIDDLCSKPEKKLDWMQWMEQCQSDPRLTETYRLWKLWKIFVPAYTNDEWASICPNAEALERYRKMAMKEPDAPKLCCFHHKNPIQGQPVFFPQHYYPSYDHFVYDVTIAFCSPQCIKNYIHQRNEGRFQDDLVTLQNCVMTRWHYPFAVQVAPPLECLLEYSDFEIVSESGSFPPPDVPLVWEKVPESLQKWFTQEEKRIQQEAKIIQRMLGFEAFQPPSTEQEYQLCISMNMSVFRVLYPPLSTTKCYLYPRLTDIFPFGISRSGPPAQFQVGSLEKTT